MIILAFAGALLASAAEPAQAVPEKAPPAKGAKPGPNEMICKNEPVLGSRLPQRFCLPQSEWDLRKAETRLQVDRTQQAAAYRSR